VTDGDTTFTVYVEKKRSYSDRARSTGRHLAHLLDLPDLTALRRILRYDVVDLPGDIVPSAISTVLSDPVTDTVYTTPPDLEHHRAFAVEYLPGQFDQRADSAAEAMEILSGGIRPAVRVSEIFTVPNTLSDDEIHRVTGQIVNQVDSRLCDPFAPAHFAAGAHAPPPVPLFERFFQLAPGELGLAMSPADVTVCRRYFLEEEQRPPTETEVRVLDTYWSDHCRHTTFETRLEEILIEGNGAAAQAIRRAHERFLRIRGEVYDRDRAAAPPTLMELATIAARRARRRGALPDLLVSEEINAATVKISVETAGDSEPWYLLFKNETHNHPTEIEPIGGAETCLGGAIRDPLSGRGYVHQTMRVTGGGDPRASLAETRPGKLPQQTITTQAARGFSSYGNQIGVATGVVAEFYHPGYVAKRLEIGAVIGAAPVSQVDHRRPEAGDLVVLIGGRTGRDGCGGATGSSKIHSVHSITEASAEVQKGNPPVERALQRLFRNASFSSIVKRANDFGAGGVSVAVGEIARGVTIDLDAVPVKYDGLTGTELAISESQERMAVVVAPENRESAIQATAAENLEATVIAQVTETERLVMTHRGQRIVDLSRGFLDTNGAPRGTTVVVSAPTDAGGGTVHGGHEHDAPPTESLGLTSSGIASPETWLGRMSALDVASRKGLSEMFDATIGAATLLAPWGGRYRLTPSAVAAARIPHPAGDVTTASMMSYGFFPRTSTYSPFHGAYLSVVESVARLVCAGARRNRIRLSLQEYFPRTGEDPARWGLPYAALLGALEAQLALDTPAIGGKDSMSGTFAELDVPPTLVSFSFCAESERRIVGPEFSAEGGAIAVMAPPVGNDGLPDAAELQRVLDLTEAAIGDGTVRAAGVIGESGLIPALTTAAMGNWCTLELDAAALTRIAEQTTCVPQAPPHAVPPEATTSRSQMNVALYLQFADVPPAAFVSDPLFTVIGRVRPDPSAATLRADRRGPIVDAAPDATRAEIRIGAAAIPLYQLRDAWVAPLEPFFPTGSHPSPVSAGDESTGDHAAATAGQAPRRSRRAPAVTHPRVCIPVFPGTNCEYDSARAFTDAGAVVKTPVFRAHSSADLDRSIGELAATIGTAEILMFPGGFSAGDEPDGSGKYIAAVFRDPRLLDAVRVLVERNDGLILGICNGFQALVRMGLLPGGADRLGLTPEMSLYLNAGLHHISAFVETRVSSTRSPWLAGTPTDRSYTVPISHGEGRLVATPQQIASLAAAGQIATQYVEYNPNGSHTAIEGICSPDGRILGKMAHNERIRPGLYRNMPPVEDMKIFENGVAYFR
jgi:phosphoribosylformylglycinamidine synthase